MKTSIRSEALSPIEILEPRTLLSYVYQPLSDVLPAPAATVLADGYRGPVVFVDDLDGDQVRDLLVGSTGQTGSPPMDAAGATILSGATGAVIRTHMQAEARFGWHVAALPDIDGDGVADYAIGSGPDTGAAAAFVFSGASGDLLYTLSGAQPTGGATVASIGDINADGRGDILVGFMGENRVALFSGADGALIREHFGDAGDEISLLGVGVGGGADLNGDGTSDYVIAGHRGDHDGSEQDAFDVAIYIHSGADGALIRAIDTTRQIPDGSLSIPTVTFDVSGDFNNDELNDIVFASGEGFRILDSGSGLAILSARIVLNGSALAAAVVGDVNRDGVPDIAVGFPTAPGQAAEGQLGQVAVYSGASGARFSILTDDRASSSNARIGTAIAFGGDVTGDGVPDIVAVAGQNPAAGAVGEGRIYAFSGAHLVPLIPDGFESDANGNPIAWGLVGDHQFLVRRNLLIPVTDLAGVEPGDRIVAYAVAADGTELLLFTSAADGAPYVWRSGANFTDGTRTDIAGFTVVGDPGGTYSTLTGIDINASGDVLIERTRDGFGPTAWLFDPDGNTLTFLFDGAPVAINAPGNVIGLTPNSLSTQYWTPGGLTTIEGLISRLINDNNLVVGRAQRDGDDAPRVYTWQDGTFNQIPLIETGQDFTAQGVNNDGTIVGIYRVTSTFNISMFVYSPETMTTTDLRQEVDVDAPPSLMNSVTFSIAGINNAGVVLARSPVSGEGFLLVPHDASGPFTVDDQAIISSTDLPDGGVFVVTRNPAGKIIAFVRSPLSGPWRKLDVAELAGVPRITGDVVTWYDEQEGLTYIAAASEEGLLLITQLPDETWRVRNLTMEIAGAEAIVVSPVVLQPQSGQTIIGGLTAAGDLVIYGQTTQMNEQGHVIWAYDNLFNSVVRAQGLPVPEFDIAGRGNLISYETSWDGLNIVGATTEGRPIALWTAPGIQGWHVTDLAAAAPDPNQVGDFSHVTVYITSWGGINIATGDNLKVLWWVPEFGGDWQVASLRDVAGGPSLRGETLSAYFAPWGGLNVAGLDEDNKLWIYWWTPEIDQWFITQLDPASPDHPVPTGNVSTLAMPGALNIFARAQSGDLIHYLWQPDVWTVTDVTLSATA